MVTAIVPLGPVPLYPAPLRSLMLDPTAPLGTFRAFIDQLVNEILPFGTSRSVADRGIVSNEPARREFSDLIGSQKGSRRELLARMLRRERDGAIHDVLAAFTRWMITSWCVGLTFPGGPMPVHPSGLGLHGDSIGRREGWN